MGMGRRLGREGSFVGVGVVCGRGPSFGGVGSRFGAGGVVCGCGELVGGGGHRRLWVCVRHRRWALGAVVVRVVGIVHAVVVMGIVVGVAVVVVVVIVVVVVVVVVVVMGVGVGSGGGGGGGGGRSNGDGCDMSRMINKHMRNKQTTGIPLHSVPVNSAEHSGLNSGMPKFRRNDQAPE